MDHRSRHRQHRGTPLYSKLEYSIFTPKWSNLSMPDPRLSPTSYAILGLLAIKPWSTYEITKQMRRALLHVWPRAESNLYKEPQRLVEAGLATAERRLVGRRERTEYAITSAGCAA